PHRPTRPYTPTHTGAQTHTHTHIHTHTHTHTHTRTPTHTHINTSNLSLSHTHTHTHKHIKPLTLIHTYTLDVLHREKTWLLPLMISTFVGQHYIEESIENMTE